MGTALFVVAAGTALLVLSPIPLTPWALSLPVVAVALLQHVPWVAAVAGLASLTCGGRLLLDVRELRQLVANRRSSFTDEVTGLPNRRAVTALLVRALALRRPVVVAVVDLTRSKEVNDSPRPCRRRRAAADRGRPPERSAAAR